ncbi:cytochrome P450 [Paenibacillus sp. Marseille-Q4541]|uniref:cytochrome P450 n=1 Tax=Paenibacillus sp. Marseille-Q4541 TaxID=2831522 RepID=UPI001BA4F8FD|nr:cytochrome P450 [Paenibacillus sp. Marseille-Q4541]
MKDTSHELSKHDIAAFFNAYDTAIHQDPYPFYTKMLQDFPAYYLEERDTWIVSKHEYVQFILKSPKLIRERSSLDGEPVVDDPPRWRNIQELVQDWMLFRDPPTHTRLRSHVAYAFTPKTLEQSKPQIRSIAESLAADMQKETNPEILQQFAFPLPVMVIADMLGVPKEERDVFKKWSNSLARLLDVAILSEEHLDEGDLAASEIRAYFRQLVKERKKNPKEDIISELIHVQNHEHQLSEEELINNCILLLVAGHETTVNLIGNGMKLFIENPSSYNLLHQNPELIPSAVEEVLRYEGPVQFTNRAAGEDIILGDTLIKRGKEVIVGLGAANRDPAIFNDPNHFDITRKKNRHLAFATGPHFCIGAPLARLEAITAFQVLLQHFPALRLADPSPVWRDQILFRGLEALHVKF